MKRIISKREEECYRLCHSDFNGLSINDTACRMKITRKAVLRLLKNIERKAPQLLPVLTPRQRLVLMCLEKGESSADIAEATGIADTHIRDTVKFLCDRGFITAPVEIIRYSPKMDGKIKERF